MKAKPNLNLSPSSRFRAIFSRDLANSMRELWIRFRHYHGKENLSLGDLYKEAFKKFLFENRIPKLVPKVLRTRRDILIDDETQEMILSINKIAIKRNQSLAIVIEEALQSYLDLPENYLGKNMEKPGKVERI